MELDRINMKTVKTILLRNPIRHDTFPWMKVIILNNKIRKSDES